MRPPQLLSSGVRLELRLSNDLKIMFLQQLATNIDPKLLKLKNYQFELVKSRTGIYIRNSNHIWWIELKVSTCETTKLDVFRTFFCNIFQVLKYSSSVKVSVKDDILLRF